MSAIWGLFNLDDRPISSAEMNWLSNRIQPSIGQSIDVARKDNVCLCQLVTCPDIHQALVAMGRIYNRAELCQQFSVSAADAQKVTNRRLISLAYAKWGSMCARHLQGDWAFALWDAAMRRLMVARDATGRTSLYYFHDRSHRRFVFSSGLNDLLSFPDIPRRLNPEYISQETPYVRRLSNTPYWGIERLTPGHSLLVKPDRLETYKYWDPHSVRTVHLPSDNAYVEQFMDVFSEAVRCRTMGDGSIGAFLSGGLDSGAVVSLAAKNLADKNKTLHAFSAVPRFSVTETTAPTRCGDESAMIAATASFGNPIHVNYLTCPNTTILEGIRASLKYTGEPRVAPSNAYWHLEIMRQAKKLGISVLLSGDGGNSTISYPGNWRESYSNMRRQSEWTRLISDIAGRAFTTISRVNIANFWSVVSKHKENIVLGIPSPLVPNLRSEHSNNPLRQKTNQSKSTGTLQAHLVESVLEQGIHTLLWNWAAAWNIEILDPTMDRRVVEFCLGIPRDQYTRWGENRLLIRKAMADNMPKSVLWNRRRGVQSADIAHRVLSEWNEIDHAFRSVEASSLAQEYLDLRTMRTVLDSLHHKIDYVTTAQTTMILMRGLGIGIFLQSIEEGS